MQQNSYRGGARGSQGQSERGRGLSRGGGRAGGRQNHSGEYQQNGNNYQRGGGRGQTRGGGRAGGRQNHNGEYQQNGNNCNRGGGRGGGRNGNGPNPYGDQQNDKSAYQQNGNGYTRGGGRGGGRSIGNGYGGGQNDNRERQYNGNNYAGGRGAPYKENGQESSNVGSQQNGGYRNENKNMYGGRNGGRGGGRDGGRGRGNGGQGDRLLSNQEAHSIMTKHVQQVAAARPEQFFAKPDNEKLSGNQIALRPNRVDPKIFKQVGVEQNLFEIESLADTAYQYDFQVALKKGGEYIVSREVQQQAFYKLYEENQWSRSTIHDGRSTVWDKEGGLRLLNYHPVKIEARKQEVYVVLKYTANVDMSCLRKKALVKNVRDIGWIVPKECIRILDSALRHSVLTDENYKVLGSQIYSLQQHGESIRANMAMELLAGYRQSVKVVTEGLVLNLNTIYKLAPKATSLLEFLSNNEVQNFNKVISGKELKDLNFLLGGVQVKTEVRCSDGKVRKLQQRIKCVSSQTAARSYFTVDGKKVSVQQYYYEKYGYVLEYPYLNLLDCSKASGHQVMVPMEVCTIKRGQFQKAEGRLQAELIKKAAKLPTLRHKDIQMALTDVQSRIPEDPAQYWIGKIQTNWLKGEAFQIPTPVIQYKDRNVRPADGEWKGFQKGKNGQMDFHPYFDGRPIKSWSVISFARNPGEVEQFCQDVVKFGQEVGVEVAPFQPQIIVQGGNPDQLQQDQALQHIRKAEDNAKQYYKYAPQILFILFEKCSTWGYQLMKTLLEADTSFYCLKLVSSVVVLEKYKKGVNNFNYMKQWMLKVNSKMDGTNFRLLDGYKFIPQGGIEGNFFPLMLMGADVTHPTGTNKNAGTSIAGVVASMDANFARYSGKILRQQGKQENIDKMETCMGEFLEQFYSLWKKLPKSIIQVVEQLMIMDW
eukprot:TRINITY_DN5921_c0_g3_i1.p1 TRINITY_DN5921_c0_g3~~TRINITY_DN5921_c0_g3_i1.p1  ORF type:complete len:928 (-),score=145.16 TRINITY_DN5921_c0_g3_i1:123-2906(-)